MEVDCIVNAVLYPPATDTGNFYVLLTSKGKASGNMSWRPRENESLFIDAEPCVYRGERQLKFSSARLNIPTDPKHLLNYVCERTSGMGTHLANQIWEKYGADWDRYCAIVRYAFVPGVY